MIQSFANNFKLDREINTQPLFNCRSSEDILSCLAGLSFDSGLYRVYTATEGKKWTDVVLSVFHGYEARISCFASDWLGRQFALDSARVVDGQPQILMFQVGLGDVFEIPAGIQDFHNDILVNMADPTLEKTLYESWLKAGNLILQRSQCAGYKVPLFLGGSDSIENLRIADMEVEWNITGQLLEATSRIPKGSRIDNINLDK